MSTTEQKALARVEAYLQRRSTANGIDREEIHSFDTGPETGIYLLASDLAELCRLSAENEALSAQVEALTKPASRWNWISDLMQVHWSEGKFTSLVRIVSEEWRDAINASVDRMMAGDLPDAGTPPQNQAIQAAQERWTHDCPAIHVAAVASWSDKCRHCGAERPAPSAPQALTRPAVPEGETKALIEQCRDALAEELGAWDIDPPLHHVLTAHDACVAWIAAAPQPEVQALPFQARVQPWLMECFGALIAGDREERNHRFLEESLELVQALGCTANEAHQLVDYTFGRPIGEPAQEVGGVMVTLAALCLANGLDMHSNGETELARISEPDVVLKIRAKQAAKPKYSPLPEAQPTEAAQPADDQTIDRSVMVAEALNAYWSA